MPNSSSLDVSRLRGRPRRSAGALRTEHVAFRVSPEDRLWLITQATAVGLTLSEFLHQRVMEKAASIIPANENAMQGTLDIQFNLVRQLRAIGNNLNQIAKHANTNGEIQHARLHVGLSDLESMLDRIDRQLDRLL